MSTTSADKVYTMTDWYDGPCEGVADFQGKPHHCCCQTGYEPYDEPSGYRLTPLDEEAFQLEIEDWAIWLRYYTACQEGRATAEMHPALPEDPQLARACSSCPAWREAAPPCRPSGKPTMPAT